MRCEICGMEIHEGNSYNTVNGIVVLFKDNYGVSLSKTPYTHHHRPNVLAMKGVRI
ncbi:hypothetical protein ACNF40_06555 [Cuniculiplasma sp. SKW4]|uniref:hypothetical protein n=1 Tax=Cuniculiplasma sp. SKW4 TaxID=3400171 RepID=UPI003FD2AEF3